MARKYHPIWTEQQGIRKKFKEINEANEELSNTVNRKKYDEYGWKLATCRRIWKSKDNSNQGSGQQGGFSGFGGGGNGGDYPIFLNLCSVVVLMVVVAEALNIKARTLTWTAPWSKGRLHHTQTYF
jgi:DnaJ-class molecular chaperone